MVRPIIWIREKKSEAGKRCEQEISSGKWTIVAGFFDPLTAEQAERIHALAESERRLLMWCNRVNRASWNKERARL